MRRLKNTVPYLVGWKARPLDTWAGGTLTLTADLAQKGLVGRSRPEGPGRCLGEGEDFNCVTRTAGKPSVRVTVSDGCIGVLVGNLRISLMSF